MAKARKKQKAKGGHKKSVRSRYVVFISHSSYDAWIARTIADQIESLGGECWLDEKDLEGGDVIPDKIIRGIDACHEAIVLISPNSVNSQWVSFEIGGVRAQQKRVTPILKNVKPEEIISSWQRLSKSLISIAPGLFSSRVWS